MALRDPLFEAISEARAHFDQQKSLDRTDSQMLASSDTEIASIVQASLIRAIRVWAEARGVRSVIAGTAVIIVDGTTYSASVARHVFNPDVLVAAVLERTDRSPRSTRCVCAGSINGFGLFQRLELTVPNSLTNVSAHLLNIALSSAGAGYDWLMERMEQKFAGIPAVTAASLYDVIRAVLGEDLSQGVWLYALVAGEAFYILDNGARSQALTALRSEAQSLGESPLTLTANLITDIQPRSKTFAPRIAESRTAVPVTLTNAPYTSGELATVEAAMYGAPVAMAQPLASVGELALIAGYNVSSAATIQPLLLQAAPRLRTRLMDRAEDLHAALAAVKRLRREMTKVSDQKWMDIFDLKVGFGPLSIDLKKGIALLAHQMSERKRRTA